MTKTGVRRLALGALLAAAAALSAWWALRMTYRPGAVLDVIPPEAEWVSFHERPAERWEAWSRNAAVRGGLALAGLDAGALVREVETPEGRTWLRRLGGREAVLAYVPATPYGSEPAWILSCWAGGYGQRLRWLLALSGTRPAPGPWGDASHPIWLLRAEGLPRGMRVALAVREGVVILAFSKDALGAMHACLEAGDRTRFRAPVPETGAADRAWLRLPDGGEWRAEAGTLTADRFRAAARRAEPWPEELGRPAAGDLAPLAGLLGRAEGWASVPWPYLRNKLLPGAGSWVGPVDALVREAAGSGEARVVFAVFGGDHAARIRSLFGGGVSDYIQGLKVPAFLLAVPLEEPAAAPEAAARFLDRFNRIHPYGLVLRPAGVCYGYTVTAVEATRGTPYKDFARSEQAAFAVAGNWLVVGSHLGALEGLLPFIPHREGAPDGWTAGAVVKMDAPALSNTLGKFLAAWSLVYLASDAPGSEEARARLELWREWLDRLAPLGQVEAWATPGPAGAEVAVSITESASAP